ncbi:hypothetical protein NP493_517g00008 [Ridgeia piscesae]|uniref:Oxoglutarate/iron-dependent oxygenase C-terminal degradation domain-containing protein n=1 Tax=Ridgeia piscesae TaxID=27915 RepID=A0AAD9KX52_RIDPI|nr:hypothetical protein NP493_517g00008 [Ridgeia piscesae]
MLEDKYDAVCKALKDRNIAWQKRGPPNKRNYEKAREVSFHFLSQCMGLYRLCPCGCRNYEKAREVSFHFLSQNYEKAGEVSLPSVLSQCLSLLQSEAMFLILSSLTGLTLHPLAAQPSTSSSDTEIVLPPGNSGEGSSTGRNKPKTKRRKLSSDCDAGDGDCHMSPDTDSNQSSARCRLELRRWSHGSYTLLHDTDTEACELALDAMFFCLCKGWQAEYGGHTTYIAKGEDEELLTVSPADNSLALVYRDKETLRFVKHVNHMIKNMSPDATFYDFSAVYFE